MKCEHTFPCIILSLLLSFTLQLAVQSNSVYYKHQSKYLFPLVIRRWRTEQQQILRTCPPEMALLGDNRSDTPGFSAKYGTYSLMEGHENKIVDFQVVQVRCIYCVDRLASVAVTKSCVCFVLCMYIRKIVLEQK